MQFIRVGAVRLALPALLVALLGISLGLTITAMSPRQVLVGVAVSGMFLLASYGINCSITGGCDKLAWAWASVYMAVAAVQVLVGTPKFATR